MHQIFDLIATTASDALKGDHSTVEQHLIESATLWIILVMLGVSHLLHLCYQLFGRPRWVGKLHHHEIKEMIQEVLSKAGIDDDTKRAHQKIKLHFRFRKAARHGDDLDHRCDRLLARAFQRGPVTVGMGYRVKFPYFIDVMSLAMDDGFLEEAANLLVSYMGKFEIERTPAFQGVVGLKEGTPYLAIRFARAIKKSICIFRGKDNYKKDADEKNPQDLFDGDAPQRQSVLIVDDSTTGGRRMMNCIDSLQELHCNVAAVLMLFEPEGKNAREKLEKKGITVLSLAKLDEARIARIRGLT